MAFYKVPALQVNLKTKEERYIYLLCQGETKDDAIKDFITTVCKKESIDYIYYLDLFDPLSNPNGRFAYKYNLYSVYLKKKQCLTT